MNLWGWILKRAGWSVSITAPRRDKCVICVAPHTSNLDFIIGLLAYSSLGRRANFLMKKFWFFFPLGLLLKAVGGIPVDRTKRTSLVDQIIERFRTCSYMNLAVTPEGTRSCTSAWHTGFLRIAIGANVPVQLGVIDYKHKCVTIAEELPITSDIDADMKAVKAFYAGWTSAAKYPEKFSV